MADKSKKQFKAWRKKQGTLVYRDDVVETLDCGTRFTLTTMVYEGETPSGKPFSKTYRIIQISNISVEFEEFRRTAKSNVVELGFGRVCLWCLTSEHIHDDDFGGCTCELCGSYLKA